MFEPPHRPSLIKPRGGKRHRTSFARSLPPFGPVRCLQHRLQPRFFFSEQAKKRLPFGLVGLRFERVAKMLDVETRHYPVHGVAIPVLR
jgi:hypothetical protein